MATIQEVVQELNTVQKLIDRLNTMKDDEPLSVDDTNKVLDILNGYQDALLKVQTYADIYN